MTQPNSLTKTFDTSLIDTQKLPTFERSFSSTETETSDSNAGTRPDQNKPAMPSGPFTMRETPNEAFTSVSNEQLYNTWASTYDTDGNVLQAVDDLELRTMLPEFVRSVKQASTGGSVGQSCRVLDFGCGTGRNTVKLLQLDWTGTSEEARVDVHGWDGSHAMLDVARQKCGAVSSTASSVALAGLQVVDFADPSAIPSEFNAGFDGIISTLVLEHLPLATFFNYLHVLLRPGGYALVTNMHPDMGRTTKAGYKTDSGERVKGESYAHGVQESAEAAMQAGLDIVGEVKEREVDEAMMGMGEVGGRGKKWIGVKVWYGFVVRKREG